MDEAVHEQNSCEDLYCVWCLQQLIKKTKKYVHLDVSAIALRKAAINGYLESMRWWLRIELVDINQQGPAGWSALIFASRYGHVKIVDILLKHGAFIDSQTHDGWTALCYAVYHNDLVIVEKLLSHGADVEIATKTNRGWTPLMWAVHLGYTNVVHKLISVGNAKIFYTSCDGRSVCDCVMIQHQVSLRDYLYIESNLQERDRVILALTMSNKIIPEEVWGLIALFWAPN